MLHLEELLVHMELELAFRDMSGGSTGKTREGRREGNISCEVHAVAGSMYFRTRGVSNKS